MNIHEAKTHFSKLIERVIFGEEILIQKSGKPVARLVGISGAIPQNRVPGRYQGRISLPDDVHAPLPEADISGFYGQGS